MIRIRFKAPIHEWLKHEKPEHFLRDLVESMYRQDKGLAPDEPIV